MNKALRLLLLATGAVILGVTMVAESPPVWLEMLAPWAGAILVVASVAPWSAKTSQQRSTVALGGFVAVALLVLGSRLAKLQVIDQDAFARKTGIDPNDGEVLSNPRLVESDLAIARGGMYDRASDWLVFSEEVDSGHVRNYSSGESLAFAGYFSPLLFGKTELEDSFDTYLNGSEHGGVLDWLEETTFGDGNIGSDLHLTIDQSLQQAGYDLLAGRPGAIVLLESGTGAVVALVSGPGFDPGRLAATRAEDVDSARAYWDQLTTQDDDPLVLRATNGLYPPGSTFKVVTAIAALETGIAAPGSVFTDDGELVIDGRVLIEENRPDDSVSEWTLAESLAYSLNLVFAQVGLELGAETLTEYGAKLGFGAEIPFDVPVATSQLVTNDDFLESPVALADTAFGQGQLLVTPLQMAMIAAAVANGGQMMEPYMVQSSTSDDGDTVFTRSPRVWRTAMTPQTAADVAEMMVGAVEFGYANASAVAGYRVGGKTGTAEVEGEEPHSWFIGFGGESEPRLAVAVVLEHSGSSSSEAARIGGEMLRLGLV